MRQNHTWCIFAANTGGHLYIYIYIYSYILSSPYTLVFFVPPFSHSTSHLDIFLTTQSHILYPTKDDLIIYRLFFVSLWILGTFSHHVHSIFHPKSSVFVGI